MTPIKMFSVAKISLIISAIAFSSLSANAALYNRGNGMIYDSGLNITWLQDANYAKTSGYDDDGRMTWQQSTTWATSLVYGGYSDWRLSSARLIGTGFTSSNDGSTDRGSNNTRSELGHLFAELGNKAWCNTAGVCYPPDYGWQNSTFTDAGTNQSVSFLNVKIYVYWEAEEFAPDPSQAWYFSTSDGTQSYSNRVGNFNAWAVRDGDVAPAVPVPAAAWLMGSGLIGLAGIARRKK